MDSYKEIAMAESETKSLLMVDDHALILMGLKYLIAESIPRFSEIDVARSGGETLELLKSRMYDMYILDFELPDMTCLELIKYIRKRQPEAQIIVNTVHEELWYIRKLTDVSVNGIVYKSIDTRQMIEAIRCVLDGGEYYCDKVRKNVKASRLLASHEGDNLTERELAVLKCIAVGKNTVEIARQLFISENTVETHRRHLNEKLGASIVAMLIVKAISRGLLPPQE